MNCNSDAFLWIIELVKMYTDYYNHFGDPESRKKFGFMTQLNKQEEIDKLFEKLDNANCLNKLVTSHFL